MANRTLYSKVDAWVDQARPNARNNGATWTMVMREEGNHAYTLLKIPAPAAVAAGSTVISARLILHVKYASHATMRWVAAPLKHSWKVNQVTWRNQPVVKDGTGPAAKAVGADMGGTPDNRTVSFDVTAQLQGVARGAQWHGWRIRLDGDRAWSYATVFAGEANLEWRRPRLEIEWSNAPVAPTDLSPSGGQRVSIASPTLSYTFADFGGNRTQAAHAVQIDPNKNVANSWKSGRQPTVDPEFDLSEFDYPGLGPGQTTFWRGRAQDEAGLWSKWSDWAEFQRLDKGQLEITNPPVAAPALINATFESGMGGFSAQGAASAERTTERSHGGNYALKSTNTASGINSVSQQASGLLERSQYTLSAWSLRTANDTGQGASLRVTGQVEDGPHTSEVLTDRGKWVYHRTTFTTGQAESPTITVLLDGSNADGGITYWDDVTLVEGVSPNALSYVTETTPPIMWNHSGPYAQEHWQVLIQQRNRAGEWFNVANSGKHAGNDDAWTVPAGVLTRANWATGPAGGEWGIQTEYRALVWTWDGQGRVTTPGDPARYIARRVFYVRESTTAPVTNLDAENRYPYPWTRLTWRRATAPDRFAIVRNGTIIDTLRADDVFDEGTSYSYLDKRARPNTEHTWAVLPIVNGHMAKIERDRVTRFVSSTGVWLTTPDRLAGEAVLIMGNPDPEVEMTQEDQGETYEIVGGSKNIRVTNALKGYTGSVSGILTSNKKWFPDMTARSWANRMMRYKSEPGQRLILTLSDMVLPVVIFNVTVAPANYPDADVINVSFEFIQATVPNYALDD